MNKPAFTPTRRADIIIVMPALIAAFTLVLWHPFIKVQSRALKSVGTLLAIVFVAGAISKFRLVGFFKSLTVGELEF